MPLVVTKNSVIKGYNYQLYTCKFEILKLFNIFFHFFYSAFQKLCDLGYVTGFCFKYISIILTISIIFFIFFIIKRPS